MRDDKNCHRDSTNHLATDNFCGNFSFKCGDTNFLVWDTDDIVPLGTVSIFYLSGCSDSLMVTVTDSAGNIDTFEVPQRNTRSRTFANLVSVRLACNGSGMIHCEGRYSLDIHYFIPDER